MSLRHSPGPWHAVLNRRGQWEIFCHTHALICRLAKWTPATDAADARLMTAAPNLLDALKAFCGDVESQQETRETSLHAAYQHALTIIAKTEGRS
jgi:hypothetical protein